MWPKDIHKCLRKYLTGLDNAISSKKTQQNNHHRTHPKNLSIQITGQRIPL